MKTDRQTDNGRNKNKTIQYKQASMLTNKYASKETEYATLL